MWDSAKETCHPKTMVLNIFVTKEVWFHLNDISSCLKKPEEDDRENKGNNKDLKWTKMVW